MKNGIVIPCYNEAERLKLNDFQKFIDSTEEYVLCFVNDGSKDNTLQILEDFQLGQEDRVRVYNMPQNGGKAEAVRSGVNHMIETTNVKTIGFIDADLATGFVDYCMLVNKIENENKEMVFGSRKADDNIDMERSAFRKMASNAVGMLTKSIICMNIKDTQCGAKVFDRKIAKIAFGKAFQSKWLFDIEIFIRVKNYFGKKEVMNKIEEVGLNAWEEVDGSKITLKDSLKFPIQLLQIAFDYNLKPEIYEIQRVLKFYSLAMLRPIGVNA